MRITTFVVKAVAMDAEGGRLDGQPWYTSIFDSQERTVRKARYLLRVMSELPMSDVLVWAPPSPVWSGYIPKETI